MMAGNDIDEGPPGRRPLAAEVQPLLYAAGNRAYATGDLATAERLYRRVLALEAGHVAARNNLAALLLAMEQGKP